MAMAGDPDVVIVDIRDVRERAKGHIPGSIHAPRGMLEFWVDPASPYHKPIFARGQAVRVPLRQRLAIGTERGGIAGHGVHRIASAGRF